MNRTGREPVPMAALLLAVVALKTAVILLDPQLRLFLGDSSTYLFAAWSDDWIPADRSFTYPMLLEWLVQPTGSLAALLYWAGRGRRWYRAAARLGAPQAA